PRSASSSGSTSSARRCVRRSRGRPCGTTSSDRRRPRRARAERADRRRASRGSVTLVPPMELVGVRVEVPANTPMVLLQESEGSHRLLPIYIGSPEAASIHYALEGPEPPRPLTHDLFVNVLGQLGARLERIVITEVLEHTYYAELH